MNEWEDIILLILGILYPNTSSYETQSDLEQEDSIKQKQEAVLFLQGRLKLSERHQMADGERNEKTDVIVVPNMFIHFSEAREKTMRDCTG